MKTTIAVQLGLLATTLTTFAGQSVHELPSLLAGSLDPAADYFYVQDMSAGAAGGKKITPNAAFTGWGFTTAGEALAKAADAPAQRTALGLVIGTDVQAYDADLTTWGGLTPPASTVVGTSDPQTLSEKTLISPKINVGSDATGDLYYRNSSGGLSRLGVGTNGQVLTLASGLPSWATGGGGGGLTNLTESLNTASPNSSSWPVAALTATGTAADIDVALVPKGNGSILADSPDGNTSGGAKRGVRSVDLQTDRVSYLKVASGDYTVISGGSSNIADGDYAVISGGSGNQGFSEKSSIGGGSGNTIWPLAGFSVIPGGEQNTINDISGTAGYNSTIGGGYQNSTNNNFVTISGGRNNTGDGQLSWIPGGRYAATRGIYGMGAWASGRFAATGDAQHGQYLLRISTTDATQTEATADGAAGASTNRIILPNNHAYAFRGRLVARSSAGDVAVWNIDGAIKRGASAAATALVGTPTVTMTFNDAGASAWVLTIDADATNGSLRIRVTGAASTTIHWLADLETVEVS